MQRTDRGDGVELAWTREDGRGSTVVFLPGLRSDMTGSKAAEVAQFCRALGVGCLRLDYSGHGASAGRFEDGTIGRWTEDALFLIDRLTEGKLILVGSSMGGWIALLAALALQDRVAGLIGIAAGPDFTETLLWDAMSFEERGRLMQDGVLWMPSPYGDPTPITQTLIEEGRRHLLLHGTIPIRCKVRLLHGQCDADVPWSTSLQLADRLLSSDVHVTLVKDGEHRLSRPSDILLLRQTLQALLVEDGA